MILKSPDAEAALYWVAAQPWYLQVGLWVCLLIASAVIADRIIETAKRIEWERFRNQAGIDESATGMLLIMSLACALGFVAPYIGSAYPLLPYAFIAACFSVALVALVTILSVAAAVARASWRQKRPEAESGTPPTP